MANFNLDIVKILRFYSNQNREAIRGTPNSGVEIDENVRFEPHRTSKDKLYFNLASNLPENGGYVFYAKLPYKVEVKKVDSKSNNIKTIEFMPDKIPNTNFDEIKAKINLNSALLEHGGIAKVYYLQNGQEAGNLVRVRRFDIPKGAIDIDSYVYQQEINTKIQADFGKDYYLAFEVISIPPYKRPYIALNGANISHNNHQPYTEKVPFQEAADYMYPR